MDLARKMSLQDVQQFQEKYGVARADDMLGTNQPHTASVGMHQDSVGDLLHYTQRWISNIPVETNQ